MDGVIHGHLHVNWQKYLLSYITAKNIYDLIDEHKVTHFGGAPIVLNMIANATEEEKKLYLIKFLL